MAYHLYTVQGLVVRLDTTGEHSRRVSIFTDELGLIRAHVQAARGSASKLKMHIQYLTLGSFTVVRGKNGYRLIGARSEQQLFYILPEVERQQVVARIAALVERLMVDDHPEPTIFSIIQSLLVCLQDHSLSIADLRSLETLTVLNILHTLGYIGHQPTFEHFLQPTFSCEVVTSFTPHITDAVRSINTALRSSGL
jgi:DNA repair protein RecO